MKTLNRHIRFAVIYLIRPVAIAWIIVNGLPPSIKAVGNAACAIIKQLNM